MNEELIARKRSQIGQALAHATKLLNSEPNKENLNLLQEYLFDAREDTIALIRIIKNS